MSAPFLFLAPTAAADLGNAPPPPLPPSQYLASDGKHKFGQPINGHREVCGMPQLSDKTKWQTKEGVYIAPPKKRAVE